MNLGIINESNDIEKRVSLVPKHVKKLVNLGINVYVQSGAGLFSSVCDDDYKEVGAVVLDDLYSVLNKSDIILKVSSNYDFIDHIDKKNIYIGYVDPFNNKDVIKKIAENGSSLFSGELIPRTTLAQSMDVLSSQANLAGYASVMTAINYSNKVFPMISSPAGTISPIRVFIIGAGVAGLQAIATAKRLGAIVEAFDVRTEAIEQIESLGAKAVKLDLGDASSSGGYARKLTSEEMKKQEELTALVCKRSDIVITTAQVFGGKSPVIVKEYMLDEMKKGSVVVDLAVESGGNVEGVKIHEVYDRNGVTIVGIPNLQSKVAKDASEMLSSNFFNILNRYLNKENLTLNFDLDEEILKSALIVKDGQILQEKFI